MRNCRPGSIQPEPASAQSACIPPRPESPLTRPSCSGASARQTRMQSSAQHTGRTGRSAANFDPAAKCLPAVRLNYCAMRNEDRLPGTASLEKELPKPLWYYKRPSAYSFREKNSGPCKLTSYGSFFLVAKEGMAPSFCVSAQWKICWYSFGSSSFVGMAIVNVRRGLA